MKEYVERNLRQEQAAETREKLLAAAKSLFAEKGYHATPVRAINRKLNMGDGILYHYFPGGKREILLVLLQESFENRIKILNQTNEETEQMPLEDVLNLVFTRAQELFMTDKELMRILIRESDILDLREIVQLSSMIRERVNWLTDFLERRYEKGEIRKIDFKMGAVQMMTMSMLIFSDTFIGLNLLGEFDPSNYRKQLIRYLMDLWKPTEQ
ncbi:TetR/AcrR family transcriptional regulator [Paenibacillus thailandensis]|uniref:TetR/AcrR family transcriptional regulator n=1 Tax=Paenibacillus thailandensis TaxID=393250 RepID=A0ABW5R0L2_9BACL